MSDNTVTQAGASAGEEQMTGRLRSSWSRRLRRAAAVIVPLVALFYAGGGWHFSNEIKSGALEVEPPEVPEYDLEVAAVGDGEVTIRMPDDPEDDLLTNTTVGLEWATGYGQLSDVRVEGDLVVRAYRHLDGAPLQPGEMVRLDGFAFPADPGVAFDIPFQEVSYESELGSYPAWFVPGSRDTWAIFVHGRGVDREEALRMLPTVTNRGYPALVITYRHDEGTPEVADAEHRFGETEWVDLEAAVQYALDQDAQDVILVGYSMGGAISASFLYESPEAGSVHGVIWDAPALSLGAMVDLGGRESSLPLIGLPIPQSLTTTAKMIAKYRFDLEFDDLNYLKNADELNVPILLFHGSDDDRVPIELSEQLLELRPDLVTYVPVEGAGHVKSWNVDPAGYERAVGEFLDRLAA